VTVTKFRPDPNSRSLIKVKPWGTLRGLQRTNAYAKPVCFTGGRSGSVRVMSSPEAAKVGVFGHAVSPLNH
jgi:hypothetical protein